MASEKISAIYIRVSTGNQNHRSQTPDLKGWESNHDGPVKWYRDTKTGTTMKRPGMDKLLADIELGKVARVVVWRLDRLGRTARGLCELFETLQAKKVDLVSLRDGFSLNSASGRLHARILASVAEFETEVRGERVRAGQQAARDKGKKWGGSEPGRRYRVTQEKLAVIRDMAAKGEKKSKIARVVGLHRHTIRAVLEDAKPVKS